MLGTILALAVAATTFEKPCDPAGRSCPTPFASIGTLVLKGNCVFFASADGGLFQIADSGGFKNGDAVWVSGTLQAFCPAECGTTGGCILDNTIGKPFQGCGTLQLGPQSCSIFVADSGEGFFLANQGDFGVGERVYVEGGIDLQSPFCQPFTAPGLAGNTIEPCFEVCGTLGVGPQSCTIVVADGHAYSVANLETFQYGDQVLVSGRLNETSLACFPVPVPAIEHNSIGTCAADADLDHDGLVNASDLALLLGNWNGKGLGDLNGDGVVDSADLGVMLGAWSS